MVFAALAVVEFSPVFQGREASPEVFRRVATVEIDAIIEQVSSVATRREPLVIASPALKDWAKVSRRKCGEEWVINYNEGSLALVANLKNDAIN